MNVSNRQLAIDATDLLNEFIGDIVTGVMVHREYDVHYRAGNLSYMQMVPIHKMCISHLILTLSKWVEVYGKYHAIFPPEVTSVCRELNKNIRRRGIVAFRNKCVGHIWNNKTGKPLVHSEIQDRLDLVFEGDINLFLKWLNDPNDNTYPKTVISIVEKIRKYLMEKYSIEAGEMVDR